MLAPQITNHVQAALARLMQQYQGLPRVEALVTGLVDQIQDLENAVYALDEGRQIYNGSTTPAVGAQLDLLGEIIGLKRNGLGDAEYLVFLFGTIAENNSDTTAAALINIVILIFSAASAFIKDPNSPNPNGSLTNNQNALQSAYVCFGAGSTADVDPSLYSAIQQIISNSVGAAIKIVYLTQYNPNGCFACAGPAPWVKGFGAYSYAPDPTVGGGFAKLVYSNPVS